MMAGWTMGFASLYPSSGSASGHGRSHGVDATGLAYPCPMVGTDANRQTEIEVDATTRLRPWRADELDSLLLHADDEPVHRGTSDRFPFHHTLAHGAAFHARPVVRLAPKSAVYVTRGSVQG